MTNLKLDEIDKEILSKFSAEIAPLNAEIERLGQLRQQATVHRDVYVSALLRKAGMDSTCKYRISPDGEMLVPVEDAKDAAAVREKEELK